MDAVSTVVAVAVVGGLIYLGRKGGPPSGSSDTPPSDVAAGRLRGARDALLRSDADTAWHLLRDPAINWAYVAAALESDPDQPQSGQIAAMIRSNPGAFLTQVEQLGAVAAGNTVGMLLTAVTKYTGFPTTGQPGPPAAL
jgi:hypothetical protein